MVGRNERGVGRGVRLAVGFFISLVVWFICAASQAQTGANREMAQTMRSVVRVSLVQSGPGGETFYLHSFGSGFVAASGVVVTNWHVVMVAQDRSDISVWITPHEGLGDRPVKARVTWRNEGADLALVEVSGLRVPPAVIATEVPEHTETVYALGYPGLMCDILHCSADETIAPTTPDFSAGPITRFAERTPRGGDVRTIFHRAPISGGNSGGPLVDNCGRIIGVNTWVSGAMVTADGNIHSPAPVSIATHPEALIRLLNAAGAAYRAESTLCVHQPQVDPTLTAEIEGLKETINQAETEYREARSQAEQVALKSQAAARLWTMIGVSAVGLLIVAVAAFVVALRPMGRNKPHSDLTREASPTSAWLTRPPEPVEARNLGRSLRWVLVIPVSIAVAGVAGGLVLLNRSTGSPVDSSRAATTSDRPQTDIETQSNLRVLQCVLDRTASYGQPQTSNNTTIEFDSGSGCVAGRTPYARSQDGNFERYLVSHAEPRVTINRISSDLNRFSQSSYFISDADWRWSREAASEIGSQVCGAPGIEAAAVSDKLHSLAENIRPRLPSRPAWESIWRCS